MYDNNSDPGRRNRGKGRRRRGHEDDGDRDRGERDRHSEAGSGKGGGGHRENFQGRRRNEAAVEPEYGNVAPEASRSGREQNRQRFMSGSGVPPPPPPPLQGRERDTRDARDLRQDLRQDPRQGGNQYAPQPHAVDPVDRRMVGHMEVDGRCRGVPTPMPQMQLCVPPGQLAMPAVPHLAQNLPMSGAFLGVGAHGVGVALPRSGEELVQSVREHCKTRNLTKVVEILRSFEDDEREQVWPVILEDITAMVNQIPQKTVTLTCEDAAEMIYQLGRVQAPLKQQPLQELSQVISDFARYKTEELTPLAISRMVWGFAHLCSRSDPLMSVVAAEVVKKIKNFGHEELANTAWAFAKCGLWNDQLAQTLVAQCLEGIEEFDTESLSNVARAMAQWSTKEERLLNKIADTLLVKQDTYEPRPMATLAWAFSTLNFRPDSLLRRILQESTRKISQFSMKEVAQIAWAFANLRFHDLHLYQKIAEHIQKQQNLGMLPAEIANIAWAFAKNHLSNQVIMNRLASEAVSQIGGFKAAEITMLTWAYAVSNLGHPALMLEIGTKVSQRSQKFTPGQLAHIIWAFGALSLKHEGLCEAVAKCCQNDMRRASLPSPGAHAGTAGAQATPNRDRDANSTYNANSLTQVVWGFAMVQYRNTSFLHEAAGRICLGIDMLKPLSLWRCASAYNAMMVNNKEIKEAILVEACKKQQDFSLKGLSRLLDCYNMHIGQKEQENLERVMDSRLELVAQKLTRLYATGHPYDDNSPDPLVFQWLHESGFLDLQVQGMKKILQKLDIQTPGWPFVSKCFREARPFWRSQAFAMLELAVAGQSHWFARSLEGPDDLDRRRFAMDALQLSQPPALDCQVLSYVLELALLKMMESFGQDEIGQVEGTMQILLSMVPCSNSIALLLQFMAKFPKIQLRFVEIQLNTQMLSNFLSQ